MSSSEDPPTVKNTPETKYVLSGQPTGWAAMSKEVGEFDEEKIQRYRDDVDTLLVFAGLFSATLTSFLLAAYPNLQPSPMSTMNYNLERIAVQTASYNFTDGKLVATTILPTSLPPFLPSHEDIRVGILWFTSLILSLVTASFGMLVKQWLREFLAVQNPSPQARLRIRHFREPQLRQWKVYEIVACLPLLLQLSLGFFFVGLCYFTSSIHKSVGHVTLPLVIGWALCFFGATALPIFLPRCPYQTTFLKAAIARFHRYLFRLVKHIPVQKSTSTENPPLTGSHQAQSPSFHKHIGTCNVVSTVAQIRHVFSARWWRTCYDNLFDTIVQALRSFQNADERFLVQSSALDVDILVSVDVIQANDESLGTTIADALRYSRTSWNGIRSFLIKVLSHRVKTLEDPERLMPEWPFHHLHPFKDLESRARESLLDILYDSINGMDLNHRAFYSKLTKLSSEGRHADTRELREWQSTVLLLLSALATNRLDNTVNKQRCVPPLALECLRHSLDHMYGGKSPIAKLTRLEFKESSRVECVAQQLDALADSWSLLDLDIVTSVEYFENLWSELDVTQPSQGDLSPSLSRVLVVKKDPPYIPHDISTIDFLKMASPTVYPTLWATSIRYLQTLLLAEFENLKHSRKPKENDPRGDTFMNALCSVRSLYSALPPEHMLEEERARIFVDIIVDAARYKRSAWMLLGIWGSTVDSEALSHTNLFQLDNSILKLASEGKLAGNNRAPFTTQQWDTITFSVADCLSQYKEDPLKSLGLCYATVTLILLIDIQTLKADKARHSLKESFAKISSSIQPLLISLAPSSPDAESRIDDTTHEPVAITQLTNAQILAGACVDNMQHDHDLPKKFNGVFPVELIDALQELIPADSNSSQRRDRLEQLKRGSSATTLTDNENGGADHAGAESCAETKDVDVSTVGRLQTAQGTIDDSGPPEEVGSSSSAAHDLKRKGKKGSKAKATIQIARTKAANRGKGTGDDE